MIFFYLLQSQTKPGTAACIPFQTAPGAQRPTPENIAFVLWNEVSLQTGKDSGEYVQIRDLQTLKEAILTVAGNDDVCRRMNQQAKNLYGIDILSDPAMPDEIRELIDRTFFEWAHPMIGNIVNSPRFRPQDKHTQYLNNWRAFPKMHEVTEEKISNLIDALGPITRTSHDQVRLCPDGVTLARAILGELTTLATRRIEKLFALDLCLSEKLYEAQQELLKQYLQRFETDSGSLKASFTTDGGFRKTEYLKYYFNTSSCGIDKQWNFYIMLIERAVGATEGLPGIGHNEQYPADLELFGEMLQQWAKLPPVVRCTIILNSFRRFMGMKYQTVNLNIKRYSCASTASGYKYCNAAGKNFIPTFERIFTWSWNRDELHETTTTYRQHLLPLWAGPSGHAHGHLTLALSCLGAQITVKGRQISVTAVVLSSLFVLWRLYYDKRISGVHTIAETYDASIAAVAAAANVRADCLAAPADLPAVTCEPEMPEDAFLNVLACQSRDMGVINPIRLMNTLKTVYFDTQPGASLPEKLSNLKKALDTKRDAICEAYELPLWSKPIQADGTGIAMPEGLQAAVSADGAAANISLFAGKNVRIYRRHVPEELAALVQTMPDGTDIAALYGWLRAKGDVVPALCLSEFYTDLPDTVNHTKVLADVTFYQLTDLAFDGCTVTFMAEICADAPFWDSLLPLVEPGGSYSCRCGVHAGSPDFGTVFTADIDIENEFSVADHFKVCLHSLRLKSGIYAAECIAPHISAFASIGDLQVTLSADIEASAMHIYGEFDEGHLFTLAEICRLFGLSEQLRLLPEDLCEEVFGNLGLAQISIELGLHPFQLEKLEFVVSTKKAWSILQDKITLSPYLCFSIEYPFDSAARAVDLHIDGLWQLGSTAFGTSVSPLSGEIYAAMQEGETLDLGALLACFAPEMEFPEASVNRASLYANYKYGCFEIRLEAADCLQASVGGTAIGLRDVLFHISYSDHALQELRLCATLYFGGISFSVDGEYVSAQDWSFSASAYSTEKLSLSKLLARIEQEIPACRGIADALPDESLSLSAGGLGVLYSAKKHEFELGVMLERITIVDGFVIEDVAVRLVTGDGKLRSVQVRAGFEIAGMTFLLDIDKEENGFRITGGTGKDQNIPIGSLLSELADKISGCPLNLPEALTSFVIPEASFSYTKTEARAKFSIDVKGGSHSGTGKPDSGSLEIFITPGQPLTYRLTLLSGAVISLKDVPVVGGIAGRFVEDDNALSISDVTFCAQSEPDEEKKLPAGVALDFRALGETYRWQIYESKSESENRSAAPGKDPLTKWITLEKSLACFSLHRIGLGLDGSYLVMELDASLNVRPLSFHLYGAGIGVNLSDFGLKFYISGFGISFRSDALSLEGELMKSETDYRGKLLIQAGQISVFAIAEYGTDGSLFAYAAATGQFGGPPAMFITGLAVGFAFHKRILLPDLDGIQDFPLIAGAMGKISQADLPAQLDKFIREERGTKVLLAGIRCSSFEVADSFLLLMVAFGNEFELDLLGLSDITMPPRCKEGVTPIAHAQLALAASLKPAEGFFGVEAKLTSESYILSKDCHLTGGFAFYMWFGGAHAGDFVITIGGYHPKYQAGEKPTHYPDVAPVGFDWKIGTHIAINGGVYFALTPHALMAGGRLCVTGEWGPLRAYFTAKADFEIGWKPFHYDAELAITIGGSLHVHVWFVSVTISLELGIGLHIWGPDFSATAHVSIWIVSFAISFGADAAKRAPDLTWQEFCDSFLPKAGDEKNSAADAKDDVQPVSISLTDGVIGEIERKGVKMQAVRPEGVAFAVTSALPVSQAAVNGREVPLKKADVTVRPMGANAKAFQSSIAVDAEGSYHAAAITQNMPSALWGPATHKEELVADVPCGISLMSVEPDLKEFPAGAFLSLEDLYEKGGVVIEHAFSFETPADLPDYTREDSIAVFSQTANAPEVKKARRKLLSALGVSLSEEISLSRYAADADSYFDEEVLIQAG